MYTTIKVDNRVKAMLDKLRLLSSETYNDIILDLIENYIPLDSEFKKSIKQSLQEYHKGKVYSLDDVLSLRK